MNMREYAALPSGASDALYMTLSTVHLMANTVHPSEAPDVHGICSTPVWQLQYTK